MHVRVRPVGWEFFAVADIYQQMNAKFRSQLSTTLLQSHASNSRANYLCKDASCCYNLTKNHSDSLSKSTCPSTCFYSSQGLRANRQLNQLQVHRPPTAAVTGNPVGCNLHKPSGSHRILLRLAVYCAAHETITNSI